MGSSRLTRDQSEAQPKCGRCGVLSGNGYESKLLKRQRYSIRRRDVGDGLAAVQNRLAGWEGPTKFKDGYLKDGCYLYDLRVCERCFDAPVRVAVGGETVSLWEPRAREMP